MSSVSATDPVAVTTLAESQTWARKFLIVLFALSGFSGLIYENIWSYYLKLFLGHAAYAQTLVLAIFMGGMAIGAWLSAKYSPRWSNTLQAYAITEGIIGIFGLVFHVTFESAIDLAYSTVLPSLGSPLTITVFKWGLSTVLILPQSILLGMTFPLMSASLIRHSRLNSGSTIAVLYFTNSLGAAVGVLISGFWLVEAVGLPGTILTAALFNILIALFAWLLARPQSEEIECSVASLGEAGTCSSSSNLFYWLMLSVALFTGMSSFIYEISWIRMLSLVLGSSTHSFELMLSAFILGLALGGLWIKKVIVRIENTVNYLAGVQIVMGICALTTIVFYTQLFDFMQAVVKSLGKTDEAYTLFNMIGYAVSLGLMLPATFCAGMTLPLLTYALLQRDHGERSVGHVYAANTVGAIIGVFGATHVGLPVLGLKGLMTLGAMLDIVIGIVLFWHVRRVMGWSLLLYPVTVAVILTVFTVFGTQWDLLKMASGVYRAGELISPKMASVVFHKDGKTATVDMLKYHNGMLSIRTNGKPDASIQMEAGKGRAPDESTMVFAAAFSLAMRPDARTVANIGFGSGLTSQVFLGSNKLERLDTIEIEPAMVEAANHFRPHVEAVYSDPRSQIHFDDAKTFFSTHPAKYDIIVSEPSNPWVSGVSSLFTDEFYRTVRGHLTDQGLFVQWFQLYEIDTKIVMSVLKALDNNFSHYALYKTAVSDLLVMASNGGNVSMPMNDVFQSPAVARELNTYGVRNAEDIRSWKVGEKEILMPLISVFEVPVNSDYFPFLDLHAARTRFLKADAMEVVGMADAEIPVYEMLGLSRPSNESLSQGTQRALFRAFKMQQAEAIRQSLLNEKYPGFSKLEPSIRRDITFMQRQLRDCPLGASEEIIDILSALSARTTSYLSPKEAEEMWDRLSRVPCVQTLAPAQELWFSLFRALSARDAGKLVALSSRLLEQMPATMSAKKVYLIMVGMTGALAMHDRQTAINIWQEYGAPSLNGRSPNIMFDLLLAHSLIKEPQAVGYVAH